MDPDDTNPGQVTDPADATPDDGGTDGGDGQPNGDGTDGSDSTEGEPKDGSQKPAEGGEQLFELPDGRKVDYNTAQYLWKEHFYPDYTKKAMRLAQLEKLEEERSTKKEEPDYSNLTPEQREAKKVIDSIKAELRDELMKEISPAINDTKAASAELEVKAEIKELQGKYPDFDPNAVMQFALNKGYTNLPLEDAYFLMNKDKMVTDAAAKAKAETLANLNRKAAAGITPNSSAKVSTGLKTFDPKTDSGKSIEQLLDEGFAELNNK